MGTTTTRLPIINLSEDQCDEITKITLLDLLQSIDVGIARLDSNSSPENKRLKKEEVKFRKAVC